jgi:3-oxoacyl-[acyl-carrier protein] reductase
MESASLMEKLRWHFWHKYMSTPRPVSIVTGGMGGIGQAIIRNLAEKGHRVCVLYYTSPNTEVETFMSTLPFDGHLALLCDITKPSEVEAAIAEVYKELDGLDNLIHAAVAPLIRKKVLKIESAEFRAQFEVTLFGGFNFFRAAIPYLQKQKNGNLVGITTEALEPGVPQSTMAGYVVAKHALRGLLRELAAELTPLGIRVNAVAPGFVPTGLHSDLPERALDFIKEVQPGKKFITPQEVAEVASFLCSADADGKSGFSYPVGSGEITPL